MDNNNATIQQNQEIQNEDLARASNAIGLISQAFSEKVVGQERLRAILIISLITGGNILLESVPGLAKTTAVKALASSVGGTFKRIQCTPDLLPSDIVGTQIYDGSRGSLEVISKLRTNHSVSKRPPGRNTFLPSLARIQCPCF